MGPFSGDPRIIDPRRLRSTRRARSIYLNGGDDRVLALDRLGDMVRDSGQIPDWIRAAHVRARWSLLRHDAPSADDTRHACDSRWGSTTASACWHRSAPRGFGFGRDGRLYLASGVAPAGEGDNTIVVFNLSQRGTRRLVADPELSPLDLTIAPNGHIVVGSEFPFGAPDAVTAVRDTTRLPGG